MATSTHTLLFFLLLVAATSTSARPCKTIFFFTSTSYYPIIPQNQDPNPNFPFQTLTQQHPRYLTFFFTSTSHFINSNPNPNPNKFSNLFLDEPIEEYEEKRTLSSPLSSSTTFMAKDIVSVLTALLFGMSCGALTAATMYLIWSLFNPHRFEFDDDLDSDDDFDSGDDTEKMVKGGYMAIRAKVIDDDVKKPASVAKEVA